MIEFITGDILKADVDALVNPVNCVGVMGRGLALQFKKAFPENFEAYIWMCDSGHLGHLVLGGVYTFRQSALGRPRWIINLPTKYHWREKSLISSIAAGLKVLTSEVVYWGIESIAIPPLGCGLGGLDWADVRPMIVREFEPLTDVRVLVYEQKEGRND